MSTPSLRITSLPESTGSATKILCFGCNVPSDVQGSASTLNDDNDDFDDPLKVHTLSKDQSLPVLSLDVENDGIVGTITLLGRSTAMVWVGWGRLQDKHRQETSAVASIPKLGAGNLLCCDQKLLYLSTFTNFNTACDILQRTKLQT